jgi:hypothetical protein
MQSTSVAFAPVPDAVPVQVPVKGGTGPVGAIEPDAGAAAVACLMEVFERTATIPTRMPIMANTTQRLSN